MNPSERLSELIAKRSVLKLRGRTRWMIIVQNEIIALATKLGRNKDLADAWNYLSILHYDCGDYAAGVEAARNSVWVYSREANPKPETQGSYHRVLSRNLEAEHQWEEAVEEGERALECFAVFHDPPDSFFTFVTTEVARMRRRRDIRREIRRGLVAATIPIHRRTNRDHPH